jgi:hypothetical protein
MQNPQSKVEEVLSPKGTISGLSMNKKNKVAVFKGRCYTPTKFVPLI